MPLIRTQPREITRLGVVYTEYEIRASKGRLATRAIVRTHTEGQETLQVKVIKGDGRTPQFQELLPWTPATPEAIEGLIAPWLSV